MIDPFSEFKNSLIKEIKILHKRFKLNTAIPIKSHDKIDILADTLVSVDDIKLSEFDSIKNNLEKGLPYKESVKKELELWEPEIINLLVSKLVEILKNEKVIDFKNYPDLRIYWKLRKIFSKEEIDNWSQIDYDWAIWNLQQDFIDKDEFDDRNLEKRKVWMNRDLYKAIKKEEETKKQQKLEEEQLLKKLIEDEKSKRFNVEFELVDAEENDIPTIISE